MKSSTVSGLKPANNNVAYEPSAAEVLKYLQNHPDFINEHQEVLEVIDPPHNRAEGTVSLIERQVNRLREQNTGLSHELQQLTEIARTNDELFARTRRLILSILTAENLTQLVQRVEQTLLREFKADACTLTLFNEPSSQQHSADESCAPTDNVVAWPEESRAIEGILRSSGAICGAFRPQELAFLFQDKASDIASAAVAPLGEDTVTGVIAIGSSNPDHYHSTMGTVFLNYITEVLNIALERFSHQNDLESGTPQRPH